MSCCDFPVIRICKGGGYSFGWGCFVGNEDMIPMSQTLISYFQRGLPN